MAPNIPSIWRGRAFGVAAGLAAALLFGASTPIAKALLASLGPVTMAGLFYLGAALATSPAAKGAGRHWRRATQTDRLRLLGAILFGGGIGPVLLLMGLRHAPAASVSLWLNLETVATVGLAWAFFREQTGPKVWMASALVLVAGVLLAQPDHFSAGRAALLVAAACLCWGLDNNLTALIDQFTPAQTTFAKGLCAGTVTLALGLGTEGSPTAAWPAALATGAIAYGWSIALYIASAQHLGAARSQMWFATAPFWGVVLSWAVLSEPITPVQGVAGAVMALGLALLLSARHAHWHVHESVAHTHSHRHDDRHHTHVHPGLPLGTRHTHPHTHEPISHDHPHEPDIHHRHDH
jgi:drug/metabolite transporter (DMT)-like permease